MSRRSFIFCDICNPQAVREVEMRRASGRDGRGRRITDGRTWFDGTDQEAQESGWVAAEDGRHICPACFERMRSMRNVLEERLFPSAGLPQALHNPKD